jgi:hypothetical protein
MHTSMFGSIEKIPGLDRIGQNYKKTFGGPIQARITHLKIQANKSLSVQLILFSF